MVAKSFMPPDAPQPAGRLVESSFALWLASWRACLGESLMYGLASLLPALAFADLQPAIMQTVLSLGAAQSLPAWLPSGLQPDPADLFDAVRAWLLAPQTWIVFGASLLGVFAALSVLIHRQHGIALGERRSWNDGTRRALVRLPAGLGAWAVYCLILTALTLPLVLLTVLVFGATGMIESWTGLLALLGSFLIGSALLSIPLAWASVAYGFAPFAVVADGVGAVSSQLRSARRVRGHWMHAAVTLTLPMLMYLGAAGAISSVSMLVCLAASYAMGGWPAVLSLDWMTWSYVLGWIPSAMALPLLTAGGVLCWNDLGLRASANAGEP
jgi:hypothetical protein